MLDSGFSGPGRTLEDNEFPALWKMTPHCGDRLYYLHSDIRQGVFMEMQCYIRFTATFQNNNF